MAACRKPKRFVSQKTGLARGYVLFHEQKPVAYALCRGNHEQFTYTHVGYDQKYAKWSPGTVLLYLLLERLFAEHRHERLDLGEGARVQIIFFHALHSLCVRGPFSAHASEFRHRRRSLRSYQGFHSTWTSDGDLGLKRKIKRLLMGKTYRPRL